MEAVEGVALRIMGQLCRLTDPGYHGDLMRLQAELDHYLPEGLENGEIAAAWAPGGGLAGEVLECAHRKPPKEFSISRREIEVRRIVIMITISYRVHLTKAKSTKKNRCEICTLRGHRAFV
jgi:hypothetical protein